MQAYTYSLIHKPTGKIYYGVRKSCHDDLFIEYFTSSKIVHQIIRDEGKEVFSYKIRKRFSSYEEARKYETKLLQKIKATRNDRVLNQAITSPGSPIYNPTTEQKRREKISKAFFHLWTTCEYRNRQLLSTPSSEEMKRRGSLGGKAKYKNYIPKPKKPKKYKNVLLIRNDEMKYVKANQVPAYKKLGWEKASPLP